MSNSTMKAAGGQTKSKLEVHDPKIVRMCTYSLTITVPLTAALER